MALVKRSFAIQGHRTSVALEPEFWAAMEQAAARRGQTVLSVVTAIDEARTTGLASAIRVWLLAQAQGRQAALHGLPPSA